MLFICTVKRNGSTSFLSFQFFKPYPGLLVLKLILLLEISVPLFLSISILQFPFSIYSYVAHAVNSCRDKSFFVRF